MKIIEGQYTFKVEGSSGKEYEVDLDAGTCNCPHFLYRLRGKGGECKHIKAVREKYEYSETENREAILEKVKKEGSIDTIWLMEEFSQKEVEDLLKSGELIEINGKTQLLD